MTGEKTNKTKTNKKNCGTDHSPITYCSTPWIKSHYKLKLSSFGSYPVNSELQYVCPGNALKWVEIFLVHCSIWQWYQTTASSCLSYVLHWDPPKTHFHIAGLAVLLQPRSAGRERVPNSLLLLTATHPTWKKKSMKEHTTGVMEYMNK